MSENGRLLEVRRLATYFHTDQGTVRAVDGIDFAISEGQTMALVGESGCGKSVTALSILRLIQDPPGKIERGEILFRGKDILKLSEKEMRSIRGNDIAMIFQEPMTSLNPVYTIGAQIVEAIELHQGIKGSAAWERAAQMLDLVGIADAPMRVRDYPHQMSGGMRQRIMIAMALSCDPALLIADEPTTALDVTIQAQVLDLIRSLQKQNRMSVLLITHDLAVVAENAEKILRPNISYPNSATPPSDSSPLENHCGGCRLNSSCCFEYSFDEIPTVQTHNKNIPDSNIKDTTAERFRQNRLHP